MRYTLLSTTLLCAALLAGCGQDKGSKGVELAAAKGNLTDDEKTKVVAKVGDRVITLEDFERRLQQQSPFARSRYNSLERKREFLQTLVRFELLALDAEAKGYDKDPDVVLARKQAMVKRMTAEEIRDLVKMEDITEADIKTFYDANKDEFDKPAEVRAAHLLVADEAQARALSTEIQAKIAEAPLKARDTFADYVRKHTRDQITRNQAGDLQFFGEPGHSRVKRKPLDPQVPPAIATAAFALDKVGDLHPEPIKTSAGWHLVQKTGFRRAYVRKLEDVQTTIRNKVFRARKAKAMEDYVKALKAKAKVEIKEDILAEAKVPKPTNLPSLNPPMMPGGGFGPGGLPMPRGPLPGSP